MPLDSPIHNLRGIPRFNPAETCSKKLLSSCHASGAIMACDGSIFSTGERGSPWTSIAENDIISVIAGIQDRAMAAAETKQKRKDRIGPALPADLMNAIRDLVFWTPGRI